MTALILRELREHARWAALAMALTALGFLLALAPRPSESILVESAQQVTTLLAAAWGLALGLLQTLPQSAPDRWALLIHRPLSRRRIFLAKAAAGAALTVLPVLVPFLLAWLWTRLPCRIAGPQDPRMVLVGLVDIACSLVYHACGLCIGLRRAGWWRSRLLVVGWGLVCSCVVVGAPQASWAFAAIAVAIIVAYAAAGGQFLCGGEDGLLRWRQRLALGLMLLPAAISATALPLVLQNWLGDANASDYTQIDWVHADGRVTRGTYSSPGAGTPRTGDATVGLTGISLVAHKEEGFWRYRSYRCYADLVFFIGGGHTHVFTRTSHHDLIVYDGASRRWLGFMTTTGIEPEPGPAPIYQVGQDIFRIRDELVMPVGGRLVPFLRLAPDERLLETSTLSTDRHQTILATSSALRIFQDRTLQLEIPRRPGSYLRLATLPDGRWVALFGGFGAEPLIIVTTDAQGTVLSEEQRPALPVPQLATQPLPLACAFLPLAPAIPAAARMLARWRDPGMWIEPVTVPPSTGIALIAVIVGAMALSLGLARRRALSTGAALRWTAAAAVLNLAAPLLLVMVHPPATRVPCPGCGARRPVTSARCPHCGARARQPDPAAIILPRSTAAVATALG